MQHGRRPRPIMYMRLRPILSDRWPKNGTMNSDSAAADHHRVGQEGLAEAELLGAVLEHEDGEDVERHLLGHPQQRAEHDLARVALDRPRAPAASRRVLFSTSRANSGDSSTPSRIHRPTPTSTRLSRNGIRQPQVSNASPVRWLQQRDRAGREQQADRHADLRPGCAMRPRRRGLPHSMDSVTEPPHSPPTPMPCSRRRTTSSVGRPEADRGVGRQHADQDAGDAHQQQRRDQRRLAADPVAPVAEDRRADRPRGEADGVGRERRQRARVVRSTSGKKSFGKTSAAAVP